MYVLNICMHHTYVHTNMYKAELAFITYILCAFGTPLPSFSVFWPSVNKKTPKIDVFSLSLHSNMQNRFVVFVVAGGSVLTRYTQSKEICALQC